MTPFQASDFHLNTPGTLIAAVPAVLGFVPEQSLIFITVEHGRFGCVMRTDLADDLLDAVEQMADVAAANQPDGVVAVIVDEDGAACRMCIDDHRELTDTIADLLGERGVRLFDAFVVDRVAVGGRWRCVDGCHGQGAIDDPMSSPLAVAAVLDGRRLYTSRAEMEDVIATVDPQRTAMLRVAMEVAEADGETRTDSIARDDVEHALDVLGSLAEGGNVVEDDAARLGLALTDPRVRDTLYALAVGRDSDRAEALWALLARTLPEPWRLEALVLFAFSAYSRGDGSLAGIALEEVMRSDSGHRMARMLDQALQTGMRPDQIRELAQAGYRMARRLGVELPPHDRLGERAG